MTPDGNKEPLAPGPEPKLYQYKVTIWIGPAAYVPQFGPALARVLGVLKRAGHTVTVEVVEARKDL